MRHKRFRSHQYRKHRIEQKQDEELQQEDLEQDVADNSLGEDADDPELEYMEEADESLMRKAALFILKIKEERKICQSTVDSLLDDIQGIHF